MSTRAGADTANTMGGPSRTGSTRRQSPLSQGITGILTDAKFQKLVREILEIAGDVGVERGLQRSILGARAAIRFAAEIAANPQEYMDPATSLPAGPKVLRGLFEKLGATYVKLGQFIASSPTLFPEEYVLEFQKCLDQTPVTDFEAIKKIIEADLGKPISQVYSYVNPVPIASASVAQVHRGTLLSTGQDVAIKVRKPGAESALSADLGFLLSVAKIVEYLNPEVSGVPIAGIMEDIRKAMIAELDFKLEAANLRKFKMFLERNEMTGAVTCPDVIQGAVGKQVLTMEFMDGVPLVDLQNIKKYTSDPEATLVSALNAWSLSVIGNDFFHADVHAGNLLVLKDGRVAFIDFGIVGTIPEKIWNALQVLSQALLVGDSRAMARALVDMGATKSEVDVNKFGSDIESIIEKINSIDPEVVTTTDGISASAQIAVDQEQVSRLLLDIVQVAEDNGVRLPREFGLLVKQALYFDRYTKLLAPSLNVMTDDRVQGLNTDSPRASRARRAYEAASEPSTPTNGFDLGDEGFIEGEVIDVK
eukprot:CAMPEP_0184493154 /NCGR_PEP_ID=MMETSP0113_2-20130426/25234_1 /TAXON_ID=91329 /ORGANISM="Norrisiella sphaerica, Strain BC52" /LENGTH=534 /DNA_ID=CAMNT_0026878307 /DNA_START=168 /DNA_END=1772 /DNA_ORIENTATION=+